MERHPMTVGGAQALRDELERLKTIERPRVILAIAEARAHGDLKENAEYHAAREQQGFIEGRIADIENKLARSHIIDVRAMPPGDKVIFGVTVEIINIDNEDKRTYQIVGDDEADIQQAKISVGSPLARALIGKSVGDVVAVQTPGGLVEYEINEVRHE